MAIKLYTQAYAGQLPDLFTKQSRFLRSFGGNIQTLVGKEADENFLKLKVSDTDVVIQEYSTDPNVAFGTGTGNSNRFGPRKEVKSVDLQVPFDTPLSIHEGIDGYTVNDIPDQVVAERLALHAIAWAERYDTEMSKVLSESASKTLDGKLTIAGIQKVFNEARSTFVNNRVTRNVAWVAYVTSEVYQLLVDNALTTTAKRASTDIDNGELTKYKGFVLVEIEDDKFQAGENIVFAADNVGVAGIGIPVTRVIESEDFAGVALQGAGKLGKYVPDKNKKAILKAKLTEATAETDA